MRDARKRDASGEMQRRGKSAQQRAQENARRRLWRKRRHLQLTRDPASMTRVLETMFENAREAQSAWAAAARESSPKRLPRWRAFDSA